MPGDGHEVNGERGERNWDLSNSLRCVAVKEREDGPARTHGCDGLGDSGDRLHSPDLVIGEHNRDDRSRGRDGSGDGRGIDPAEGVNWDHRVGRPTYDLLLEELDDLNDCWVLDGGDDDVGAVKGEGTAVEDDGAGDSGVVGFGAAGSEDDLVRVRGE
jgi:hypothetical protein